MAAPARDEPPTRVENFSSQSWSFRSSQSHIMKSAGDERSQFEQSLKPLPELPEMTFNKNFLHISHESGFFLDFNAVDALKLVDPTHDLVKVAYADDWKNSREDQESVKKTGKTFDWTFSTKYQGTVGTAEGQDVAVEPSDESINYEKLKVEEKILFYCNFLLFEDELADNGASILSVKFRAMPSGFFALLRFYLRVDDVMVRIYDTRIHHEYGSAYLLREFSHKECEYSKLSHISPTLICDHNRAADFITLVSKTNEKIVFPSCAS